MTDWRKKYIALYKQFQWVRAVYIAVTMTQYLIAVALGIAWCLTKDQRFATATKYTLLGGAVILAVISLSLFRNHSPEEQEASDYLAREKKQKKRRKRRVKRETAETLERIRAGTLTPAWNPELVTMSPSIRFQMDGSSRALYFHNDCGGEPTQLFSQPWLDENDRLSYVVCDFPSKTPTTVSIPVATVVQQGLGLERLDPPIS